MSKEIDLIKCIISEIDNNLYSDFGGNPCISYTSNLKKLLLALDTPEVRHFFENYNKQTQRIAELEEQLKNAIVPKFKIEQTVYRIYQDKIENGMISEIRVDELGITYHITMYKSKYCETYCYVNENGLFATKEEAQAKLEELKGE